MDPIAIKKQFGSQIALHGGIDALLWGNKDKLVEVIQCTVPELNRGGGYIFSTDHSIPSCVSLLDYKDIVSLVKKL
jgi:uroporphyrinogen decarboxylase